MQTSSPLHSRRSLPAPVATPATPARRESTTRSGQPRTSGPVVQHPIPPDGRRLGSSWQTCCRDQDHKGQRDAGTWAAELGRSGRGVGDERLELQSSWGEDPALACEVKQLARPERSSFLRGFQEPGLRVGDNGLNACPNDGECLSEREKRLGTSKPPGLRFGEGASIAPHAHLVGAE